MTVKRVDKDKIDPVKFYRDTFNEFEQRLNGEKSAAFHQLRRRAMEELEQDGFPTPRVENWRYLNLKQLLKANFPLQWELPEIGKDLPEALLFGLKNAYRIVMVNGIFHETLSLLPEDGAFELRPLAGLLKSDSHPRMTFGEYENDPFARLNTAFSLHGWEVTVGDRRVLEKPIQILHLSVPGEKGFQSHPRMIIRVGNNSEVTIFKNFHALEEGSYLNNPATFLHIGENSVVDYIRLQDEDRHAFHISNTYVTQKAYSVLNAVSVDLGGQLVRHNAHLLMEQENAETNLSGFYLVGKDQQVDNHTFMDHAVPRCNSNELFKGILAENGKGVFSGTILVREDAQQTNAFQSNKNLLLSEQAEINSKPQLKIYADDVKCTHGATVGQLDEEALFYLRQRGISEEAANVMLRFAFAGEVLGHIRLEALRESIDNLVHERMEKQFQEESA